MNRRLPSSLLYLVKVMVVDEPSTAVDQLEDKDCGPNLTRLALSLSVVLMAGFGIFGMGIFKDIAGLIVKSLS